jgi:hypothetical protein
MVGGSLRVLWFLPALKLVAMILLKVALNTKNIKKKQSRKSFGFSFCTTLKICLLWKNIKSIGELLVPVKEMFENAE